MLLGHSERRSRHCFKHLSIQETARNDKGGNLVIHLSCVVADCSIRPGHGRYMEIAYETRKYNARTGSPPHQSVIHICCGDVLSLFMSISLEYDTSEIIKIGRRDRFGDT